MNKQSTEWTYDRNINYINLIIEKMKDNHEYLNWKNKQATEQMKDTNYSKLYIKN